MKPSLFRYIIGAVGIVVMASCAKEAGLQESSRTITVNCPVTKTSISYEGSDVSHLVWSDGDSVAYVTSCEGDVVKVAEVSHNSFMAVVPESASTSDKLFVVYPAGDNEGKTMAQMKATVLADACQDMNEPFDGTRYPMVASVSVPAASVSTVRLSFDLPAAVLRFHITAKNRAAAIPVRTIELSADQPLEGSYVPSSDNDEGFSFLPGKNIKTVSLSAADDDLKTGEDGLYVYAVVPRQDYTSFTVRVVTDSLAYTFADGKMNLLREDRSLYRIGIDLSATEGEEVVKDPYAGTVFRPVTTMDELNSDSRYLIVADMNSSNYLLAAPDNLYSISDKPSGANHGIKQKKLPHIGGEVAKADELLPFVVALEKGSVEENTFAINFIGAGENKCSYACAPGAATNPVNNGFFMNPSPLTDSEVQGYWAFSIENGYVIVRSRKTENQRFRFVVEYNEFRPCRDDAADYDYDVREIKFLRLQ